MFLRYWLQFLERISPYNCFKSKIKHSDIDIYLNYFICTHILTAGVEFASSVNFNDTETLTATWQKLEELVISSNNQGTLPSMFKPQVQCFTNKTDNSGNPCAVVNGMDCLYYMMSIFSLMFIENYKIFTNNSLKH